MLNLIQCKRVSNRVNGDDSSKVPSNLTAKLSVILFFHNSFPFSTGVIPHIHKSLIGKKGANKPT